MTTAMAPTWTLGDRLAKARRHAGLEQEDLARELGVSRALVGHWERDRSEPRTSQTLRWAEVCKVEPGWLLGLGGNASFADEPTDLRLPAIDEWIRRLERAQTLADFGDTFAEPPVDSSRAA